jgi:hypothetical protein
LWAGGVLVLTTVAPSLRGAKTIRALSRLRGPRASARKRGNSGVAGGQVRARAGRPLAAGGWRGQLRSAVGGERRARRQGGAAWRPWDQERRGTWWRVWQLRHDEIGVHVLGGAAGREAGGEAGMQVLMERPRHSKLPRLPDKVIDLDHGLPRSAQEALREAA